MDWLNIAVEVILLIIVGILGVKIYRLDEDLETLYEIFSGHTHDEKGDTRE